VRSRAEEEEAQELEAKRSQVKSKSGEAKKSGQEVRPRSQAKKSGKLRSREAKK
jgi:hypothetical protein